MYGTIAAFRAYATLRGNLAPADATDGVATAALVRASDYIRTRYVIRFASEYTEADPRVEEATYIAAQLELTTPGFWVTTYTASSAKVLTRVGDIQWTLVGASGMGFGPDSMLPTSPAIDALLMPLTRWGMPAVFVV